MCFKEARALYIVSLLSPQCDDGARWGKEEGGGGRDGEGGHEWGGGGEMGKEDMSGGGGVLERMPALCRSDKS